MSALGVLPFLALLLAGLRFARDLGAGSWRRGWLRVAVLWGVFCILSLELLSLFGAVTQPMLLALWLPITAALGYSLITRPRSGLWLELRSALQEVRARHWALLAGTAIVLALTATVAWLAPPNTWDSLNYHMPRVAHWAQLGAVRHFPTGIEIQNSMAPGAEMLILHTYVLGQSDRWANFVQWFAMVGGLAGVSLIARQLGSGRTGRWAAVAFAASLPTGIIQASSTMTDATAAFFVLVAVSELLALWQQEAPGAAGGVIASISAAALAVHVKPTAAVFLAPFVLIAAGLFLRRVRGRSTWAAVGAGLLLSALIVGPHLLRNTHTYGIAIGNPGHLAQHRLDWLGGRGPASVLSRNLAMHAGTPSPHVNKGIARGVQLVHEGLNLAVNDPRTTAAGQFKVRFSDLNEDKATNPIHMWLLFVLIPLGVWRSRNRRSLLYAGAVAAGFVLFSAVFEWNEFGGRLQHPFFVLAAPAVTIVGERLLAGRWLAVGSLALLLAAGPWLLQIKSRPLLSDPGESYVGSILTTPREELYFANGDYLQGPYLAMTDPIEASGCQSVRIRLAGVAAEYPIWVLLGAPRSKVEIGWSVAGTQSAGLGEQLAPACAVVCHDCPADQADYGALPRALRHGGYSLYLDAGAESGALLSKGREPQRMGLH